MGMPAGSMFDTINNFDTAITATLNLVSSGLAESPFVFNLALMMMTFEIVICLVTALAGSGQQAIQRGILGFLILAFAMGMTQTPGFWRNTIVPMVQDLPGEVLGAIKGVPPPGLPANSGDIKSSALAAIAETIRVVIDPTNLYSKKGYETPSLNESELVYKNATQKTFLDYGQTLKGAKATRDAVVNSSTATAEQKATAEATYLSARSQARTALDAAQDSARSNCQTLLAKVTGGSGPIIGNQCY